LPVVHTPPPHGLRQRLGYFVVVRERGEKAATASAEATTDKLPCPWIMRTPYHQRCPPSTQCPPDWHGSGARSSFRPMQLLELARELEPILEAGGRLVRLGSGDPVVFVGDIHGDLDALERVLLLGRESVTVFLGDLVDRGPSSREVLARAMVAKLERPRSIHLLMGNHEAWGLARFRPADFWESLPPDESAAIAASLVSWPLAAWHPAGVLALHGALPDVTAVDEILDVVPGGPEWRDITWGDWGDDSTGDRQTGSRPLHGAAAFAARADRLGIHVLVRSHQPDAPLYLYGDRCLTLFTSSAYGEARRIALLPPERSVRTARDLDLVHL
jgi:hypothetical protein